MTDETDGLPGDLLELCGDWGLRPPPLPPELAAGLRPTDRQSPCWSTGPMPGEPYELGQHITAVSNTSSPLAVVAHDGHGVNSLAWHVYVVQGPLACFVQSAWGGIYQDPDGDRYEIDRRMAMVIRLLSATAHALDEGRIGPRERLLFVDTSFHGYGAQWLDDSTPRFPAESPLWPPNAITRNRTGSWDDFTFRFLVGDLLSRAPGRTLPEAIRPTSSGIGGEASSD